MTYLAPTTTSDVCWNTCRYVTIYRPAAHVVCVSVCVCIPHSLKHSKLWSNANVSFPNLSCSSIRWSDNIMRLRSSNLLGMFLLLSSIYCFSQYVVIDHNILLSLACFRIAKPTIVLFYFQNFAVRRDIRWVVCVIRNQVLKSEESLLLDKIDLESLVGRC